MKLLVFIFLIILGIVGMLYPSEPEDNTLRDAIVVIERNMAIIDTELIAGADCLTIAKVTNTMNSSTCDEYVAKMNISMQATVIGLFMISNLHELGFVVQSDPYYDRYLDSIDKLAALTKRAANLNQSILIYDIPEEPKFKT